LILVNEPVTPAAATNYSCSNVTFKNVSGSGTWYAIVSAGNDNSVTSNIVIDGGAYDGGRSPNAIASIGVGEVTYGGSTSTARNTANLTLKNLKMTNVYNQAVRAIGNVRGFTLANSTIGMPRTSALPLVELQGTTGSAILNNGLMTLGNDAIAAGTSLGPSNVTAQLRIIGNTVGGVRDARSGIRLKNANAAVVQRNVITPAASTTGLSASHFHRIAVDFFGATRTPLGSSCSMRGNFFINSACLRFSSVVGEQEFVILDADAADCEANLFAALDLYSRGREIHLAHVNLDRARGFLGVNWLAGGVGFVAMPFVAACWRSYDHEGGQSDADGHGLIH
jgi:hypothetical protein